MTTLEARRELQSALFIFDLLKGTIEINELKNRIKISNNPYSTRSRNYLVEESSKTDFGFNDIISICLNKL